MIFYCVRSVSEQVTKIGIGTGFRFSSFCRGEAAFYAQEDIILTFKWSKLPTIDKHLISPYSQTSRGEAAFYAQEDIISTFKWSKLPTIDEHLISPQSHTSESNNRVMRIRKMILN